MCSIPMGSLSVPGLPMPNLNLDQSHWTILTTESDLEKAFEAHQRIFVDMPIGLPDKEPGRSCDQALRKALGRSFSSSVFSPPSRLALAESDYPSASRVNHLLTGKKLTIQSWNLFPKIRELDRILLKNPSLQERVFESHPEWLFRIAHPQSIHLEYKKKTPEGLEERLQRLSLHSLYAQKSYEDALGRFPRSDVARDDILDAMILAVMSAKSMWSNALRESQWEQDRELGVPDVSLGGLRTFPELGSGSSRQKVQRDGAGLPKAIWYPSTL